MTKNDIINELINNPEYDSEWIGSVAEIVSKNFEKEDYTDTNAYTDISTYKNYNAGQMEVIKQGLFAPENPYDLISEIHHRNNSAVAFEFNATQLQLLGILIGYIKSNPDKDSDRFNILFNYEIPYAKLNFVIKGIVEGYDDMIDYIDFDPDQICEIYAGHKDEVNYASYASKDIPDTVMGAIRYCLNNNITFTINDNKTITISAM